MWKALLVKTNSKVASVIGRIRYHLKVIKGNAIADHLANNVVENYDPLNFDLSNGDVLSVENGGWMNEWWTMYFDGGVNISGNGAGALIISLEKKQYLVSVKLSFKCTKNTIEYEACIIGLEDALELKVEKSNYLSGEREMRYVIGWVNFFLIWELNWKNKNMNQRTRIKRMKKKTNKQIQHKLRLKGEIKENKTFIKRSRKKKYKIIGIRIKSKTSKHN